MSWFALSPLPFPSPQPEALHLVVSTDAGGIFATVREIDGSWKNWTDVLAATAPLHPRTTGPPADNPPIDSFDSLALTAISAGCVFVVQNSTIVPWFSTWTSGNVWSTREGAHETEWPVGAALAGAGLTTQYALFAPYSPSNSGLVMTGLTANNSWSPWSHFPLANPSSLPDLPSASVSALGVDRVAAAFVGGTLHILIGTWVDLTVLVSANLATGCVWHTAQKADGSFSPWAQLPIKALIDFGFGHSNPVAAANVADSVTAIALCDIGGTAHVGLLGTNGGIWHYTLDATGTLSPGDYNQIRQSPAGTIHMAMCAVEEECHFVVASSDGGLWHSIRHSDESWSPWGDVWGQVPRLGANIVAVAVAGSPPLG